MSDYSSYGAQNDDNEAVKLQHICQTILQKYEGVFDVRNALELILATAHDQLGASPSQIDTCTDPIGAEQWLRNHRVSPGKGYPIGVLCHTKTM